MAENKLFELAPVIRGLLAGESDDEDRPHRTVLLKALTDDAAVDFASSPDAAQGGAPPAGLRHTDTAPLYVEPPAESAEARESLASAVEKYAAQHGCKPPVVCVKGSGVLQSADAPTDASSPLHNRVAMVTGAAGAIGHGICQGLLERGACVVATDLAGERFDALVEDLRARYGKAVMGAAMDVTDKDSVAGAFDAATARFGGVDIVVVNAGIALVSKLMELDLDAFRKLERVNVEGALLTLAEAGRHMKLQGTGGDIVIVSTKNVPSPGAGFGAYSSTKAACHQLGRIASLELAEFDIRVNMVSPDAVFGGGQFKSGLWAEVGPGRMKARGLDEAGLQDYYRGRNLLKARVTARHVANAVLFFVTRQTPTTGATIPVDGGLPDATPR